MSAPTVVLHASHTHLYPGASLRAAEPLCAAALLIEFSDLGTAAGVVESVIDDRALIAVAAHRTARGTVVSARRWLLEPQHGAEGAAHWRVLRRIRAGPG